MLRMLEPEVEEGFEPGKKKRTGSRELLEEQKMRHKLKQVKIGLCFIIIIFCRSGREHGRRSGRTAPSWQRSGPGRRGGRTRTGRTAPRRSSPGSPARRATISRCLKRRRNFKGLFKINMYAHHLSDPLLHALLECAWKATV
jgi:hypothetical protein